MIQDFINKYLNKAQYEMIDTDSKGRFYGEIKELRGVWATGKTLEECRQMLADVLEGWLVLRLRKNLPIPNLKISSYKIPLKAYA